MRLLGEYWGRILVRNARNVPSLDNEAHRVMYIKGNCMRA